MLPHACSKSAYGRCSRSATARETAPICSSSSCVDDELEPRRARDHLDGAVVVRRAEAAGDEARVGFQRVSERRFELGGVVADDRDPRRLEPVAKRLGREERAVPVSPLAADELAAGGDDRRPRARGHRRRIVTPGECVMRTPAGLRACT